MNALWTGSQRPASTQPESSLTPEQRELRYWATCAEPGATPDNYRDECKGLHVCVLPFRVIWTDRGGKVVEQRVNSRSISDHGAVLMSRKPLPMFDLIAIQLDDGTERPVVPAKVVDYDQTVGGYLAHVEFLIDLNAPQEGATELQPAAADTAGSFWKIEPAATMHQSA